MYGNKYHWLHENKGVDRTKALFKTLVRLKIVDPIYNPIKWNTWYATLRRFVDKYEP